MSQNNGLTTNQKKAVKALLTHSTIGEAAEAVGVNRRTVTRWLDDRDFKAGLSAAEGDLIDATTRRLLRLADKAIGAIEDIIDNPDQRGASNKRLAAQAVLDHLLKLRELRNVEQRISDLESAVYGQHK